MIRNLLRLAAVGLASASLLAVLGPGGLVPSRDAAAGTGAPVVSPASATGAPGGFALAGGARFRNFSNDGGQEVLVGANPGVPPQTADQRTWILGANTFSFEYKVVNAGADELIVVLNGNTSTFTYATDPSGPLNYINLFMAERQTSPVIDFKVEDLKLDGLTLSPSSFTTPDGSCTTIPTCYWAITGYNLSTGFKLEGKITLSGGAFSTSDELNKVEITFGSYDILPPVVSGVAASPDPVDSGTPVAVSAMVSDALTGASLIKSAEYSTDGGLTWAPMSATDGAFDEIDELVEASFLAPISAGNYQVCVRGTDVAGLVAVAECTSYHVNDATPPVVTATVPPPGSGGWYTGPVVITFVCTDEPGGSGIAPRSPHNDTTPNGSGNSYPASIRVTRQGVSTVTLEPHWRCVDRAGNVAAPPAGFPLVIKIDSRAPTCRLAFSPSNAKGLNAIVRISATASDAAGGSGVAGVVLQSITPRGSTPAGTFSGHSLNSALPQNVTFQGANGRSWGVVAKVSDIAGNTNTCTRTLSGRK
ncbi:MAG: hypothetical protein ACKVVT_05575 [Dehalococcoidia bacterium]